MTSDRRAALRAEFPECHVVSARTGEGLDRLRAAIWERSSERGLVEVP